MFLFFYTVCLKKGSGKLDEKDKKLNTKTKHRKSRTFKYLCKSRYPYKMSSQSPVSVSVQSQYQDDFAPTSTETLLNVKLTFNKRIYPQELYDVYLDKMLHQFYALKHPYQEGHPTYYECNVCRYFNDIVTRRYFKVGNDSTKFHIIVEIPKVAVLKLFVEEKKKNGSDIIHVSFRAETYILQPSYQVYLKKPMKIQHFLLSWMNSLLLELQNHSTLTQGFKEEEEAEAEFKLTEKDLDSEIFETYFLRSSLF